MAITVDPPEGGSLGTNDVIQILDWVQSPGETDDGHDHAWHEVPAWMIGRRVGKLPIYGFRRSPVLVIEISASPF